MNLPLEALHAMTQSNNTPNRINRLENDVIDLKLATSSLIETVEIHQRNFELMIAEMQRDRAQAQAHLDSQEHRIELLLTEMQRDRAQVQTRLNNYNQRVENLEQIAQDIRQILQILTQRLTG
jgi:predicted RNase H-like nuclease (RuvC/YqgF family)